MACKQLKFAGRSVVLEYAIKCGDEYPLEGDWKRIGSMRTKELTIEWDTIDATADDGVGALRENLASFQTMTISGDGVVKASGSGSADLIALQKHVIKPDATGGQPTVWLRMTFPDLTFIAYMLMSSFSRSAPYDDVVTYSLEASATASDFGLIVEDTPDPDAPDVTSVTVEPATLTLEVGEQATLTATVAPVGAPSGVVWSSDDVEVATVVPSTGEVTAVGEGTATIRASSTVTPSVFGESIITVEENP